MRETHRDVESKEILPDRKFQVIVIGPACSGKTTILSALKEQGHAVRTEPDNPMMMRFIGDPRKYAFQNQVYKSAQLMEQEVEASQSVTLTDPYFRETGVLGTAIYNRYLRDQGLISPEQYALLEGTYQQHMDLLPKPDMVVYLHADDRTIKDRAIRRDGMVAHDPHELQPYFDELLQDLEGRGILVYRINTGKYTIPKTSELILEKISELKETRKTESGSEQEPHTPQEPQTKQDSDEPFTGIVAYRSIRLEIDLPQ